jgi:hypothetical protein
MVACRKAAEVAEEEEGEVAELSSMFTVGQPLIVAVVSCLQVCYGTISIRISVKRGIWIQSLILIIVSGPDPHH